MTNNNTTSTCNDCGLVMRGDYFRCMSCYYEASTVANYFD